MALVGISSEIILVRGEGMMRDGSDPQTTLKEVLARDAADRVTHRAIRVLQTLRGDNLQSGADSGLRDVWDEICVQVQGEQSVFWDAYMDVLEGTVQVLLKTTPRTQLHAMWLETDRGEEWLDDVEAEGGGSTELPYDLDGVLDYLRQGLVWAAEDWSNGRIRRYLDRE